MDRRGYDYRNPYGSKGGYVDSRRDYRQGDYNNAPMDYRGGDMRIDYAQNRNDYNDYNDYNMDYRRGYDYYGTRDMAMPFYQKNNRDYAMDYRTDYYRGTYGDTPFEMMQYRQYDQRRDYDIGRDYHSKKLGREEIEMWSERLMQEVDKPHQDLVGEHKVMQKAKEMGIKFEEYSPEEFYVVVMMMYTDYCKTLGSVNIDTYIRLAKDWLEDKDSKLKGSEKLSAYYKHIIEAR